MFLLTVLVPVVLCGAGVAAESHTYRRTDPVTGQQMLCDRCPPGTRLRAHCTRSSQTECAPCGAGLFTESWNYIPDCLRCDACSDHQRVVRPCNGSVNTVCECEGRFFWDQYFCRRHSVCEPGHGVKAPGTPHKDTQCELCADGHYADITQTQAACVTHSDCKADERLLLRGSSWHDNVCATCEQTQKGLLDLLKPVLSGVFTRDGRDGDAVAERLKKIVLRQHRKRLGKRAAQQRKQPRSHEVREEELNLSSILKEPQLNWLAHKITQKIQQFQQHCTNTIPQTL